MKAFRILLLLCLLTTPAVADSGPIYQAAWSEDGKLLLTIGPKRQLRLHDGTTGQVLKTTTVPGNPTTYISFSPDSGREAENSLNGLRVSGTRAVTSDLDYALHWWSVPELEPLASSSSTYGIVGIDMGGDLTAYTCTSSRYLDSEISWKRLTPEGVQGSLLPDLPAPYSNNSYGAPDVSPDGQWVLANTDDGVRLWDLRSSEVSSVLLVQPTPSQERSLARERFYCLIEDEIVGYSYEDPQAEPTRIRCGKANRLFVTSDETRLFVQNEDALVTYDLSSGAVVKTWNRKGKPLLTLSPDGSRGFGVTEKSLEAWDIATQTLLYRLKVQKAE